MFSITLEDPFSADWDYLEFPMKMVEHGNVLFVYLTKDDAGLHNMGDAYLFEPWINEAPTEDLPSTHFPLPLAVTGLIDFLGVRSVRRIHGRQEGTRGMCGALCAGFIRMVMHEG